MLIRLGDLSIEADDHGGLRRIADERVPDVAIYDAAPTLEVRRDGTAERLDGRHLRGVAREGEDLVLVFEKADLLRLTLRLGPAPDGGGISLRSRIENLSRGALALDRLSPLRVTGHEGALRVGHDLSDCSFFKNGWQSWSGTESLRVPETDYSPYLKVLQVTQENPAARASGKPGDFRSEAVTCVQNLKTGGALLAGFVTGADQFSDVRLRVATPGGKLVEFAATCHFDGIPLAPGAGIDGEELRIAFGRDAGALLAAWADATGRRMKARVPEKTPIGWCSWYYYYTGVTEKAVRDNLDVAAARPDAMPFHYFQIDDGYQRAIGDWLDTSEKFPSGMKSLADAIRGKGYVPGIWTAPFIAGPRSRLLAEHPDWLLQDARGRKVRAGLNPLWKGWYYALDTTHPEVERYVRNVFRTFREMGYGFFKIDFVYAAAMPGVRRDRSATRAQAYRRAIGWVREEVGDSFLLGCGAPLLPSVGVVDAMRIGPDVTPAWGSETLRKVIRDKNSLSAVNAIRNTINRAFLHRRLWVNDPDCLMVRRNRSKLTEDEVRTLCSVIAASGGMILLSDDLAALQEDRVALIRRVADLSGEGFSALDLMERPYPELLAAPRPWGALLVVINYRKQPVDRVVDLRRVFPGADLARVRSIREAWEGRELRHRDGLLVLDDIAPHGVALVEIRTDEPA